MKKTLLFSIILLSLCSCEPRYLADARKSLADSIQTNLLFCNYSINGNTSRNNGTIEIKKRTDKSVGLIIHLFEENEAVTKIAAEGVPLTGTLERIEIMTRSANITIVKIGNGNEAMYKSTATIEGWLHNKELTRSGEQWEYDVEGELTISYVFDNTKETAHIYNIQREQPE
ncbi:MAG: hypothetical protein J6W09_03465 [Bacteroidales bacterium]|nr:hypothetical protein [Bacteroidales bacterium]